MTRPGMHSDAAGKLETHCKSAAYSTLQSSMAHESTHLALLTEADWL